MRLWTLFNARKLMLLKKSVKLNKSVLRLKWMNVIAKNRLVS